MQQNDYIVWLTQSFMAKIPNFLESNNYNMYTLYNKSYSNINFFSGSIQTDYGLPTKAIHARLNYWANIREDAKRSWS
ncbi:hypothetical protein EB796_002811 [Bugula neritina]|uniref:Uncharacterized protein n=1 Tax=Bugula neritina TaxID=10212 RepID=A0A7J7KKN6_BUGNE|nr:hypothetical protein EB796_002811 [Bugula neritina]